MILKQKIENIETKIKKHEYDFFVLGEETISEPEMEILKVELDNLKLMEIEDSQPTPKPAIGENLFEFHEGI